MIDLLILASVPPLAVSQGQQDKTPLSCPLFFSHFIFFLFLSYFSESTGQNNLTFFPTFFPFQFFFLFFSLSFFLYTFCLFLSNFFSFFLSSFFFLFLLPNLVCIP